MFLRWRCSIPMPMGCWRASCAGSKDVSGTGGNHWCFEQQTCALRCFLASILDRCVIWEQRCLFQCDRFMNLLYLSLQGLCWFLYGGDFLCPGETEVEKEDHIQAEVLIWDLRDLGLIPSTDFPGQNAKSPTPAISKTNVEISSNLPSGAANKTLMKKAMVMGLHKYLSERSRWMCMKRLSSWPSPS